MAKVRGPLLSMDAQGQIGKSQVYAQWRGVPYARRYTSPSNPNTTSQQSTRNTFRSLDAQFKRFGSLGLAPWNEAAKGRPLTGRNLLMSVNIPPLRGDSDMADYIGSPGVRGGLSATDLAAVAGSGSGEIDVTVDMPGVPTDWTLDACIITAFKDRDPADSPQDFVKEAEVLETNFTGSDPAQAENTFTGLDPDTDYVISAWTRWTRADGKTAYSPSLTEIATSAA